MKGVTIAQDQYKCEACGATFDTKEELKEHNRMMHSRYQCEECGQNFNSVRALEEHERMVHPEKQGTPRS